MRTFCPISGIQYESSVSIPNLTTNHPHPIFSLSLKQILASLPSLDSYHPESNESYLLRLALVSKLPVTFETTINKSAAIPFLLNHTQMLATQLYKLDKLRPPEFPTFIVTKETSDLSCLPNWIETIQDSFSAHSITAHAQAVGYKLKRLEDTINKLINSSFVRNHTRVASIISDWAAIAGDFPNTHIEVQYSKSKVPLRSYWQLIIKLAYNKDFQGCMVNGVSYADVDELIDYCEDYIPHGSIHASVLMSRLRNLRKALEEFKPNVTPLKYQTNNESNPAPKRKDFGSNMEYIKAKLKWQSTVIGNTTFTAEDL